MSGGSVARAMNLFSSAPTVPLPWSSWIRLTCTAHGRAGALAPQFRGAVGVASARATAPPPLQECAPYVWASPAAVTAAGAGRRSGAPPRSLTPLAARDVTGAFSHAR